MRGEGHRLMTACRESAACQRGDPGESEPLRCCDAENKPLFYFQMCKYERWDVRLPDIVCKNTPHSRIPPVHQSHRMPQFYFQRDRSSI